VAYLLEKALKGIWIGAHQAVHLDSSFIGVHTQELKKIKVIVNAKPFFRHIFNGLFNLYRPNVGRPVF
jgi:hypothetical protein